MRQQELQKGHRTKSEKVAKTTKRRRGTRPRSNAQFICDSRDERTDKETTNSDHSHTDRARESWYYQRLLTTREPASKTSTLDESDSDELREEREMQDEVRRWNAQTEATWVKEHPSY